MKRCKVKNLDLKTQAYIQQRNKYTHRKQYQRIGQFQRIEKRWLKHYHYTRGLSANDPMLYVWAKKELNERIEFCPRFFISNDYGQIICRREFERKRRQQRLDRVKEGLVCFQELGDCLSRLSLDSTCQYQTTKKSDDDDWNDFSHGNFQHEQLNKIYINTYLFENYYMRSDLNEVEHLNLIEKISRRKQCADNDNW